MPPVFEGFAFLRRITWQHKSSLGEALVARRVSGGSTSARQNSIERIGECMFLSRPIGRVAAGLYSGTAKIVHEIPHRQSLSNDFGSVLLSSWIDHDHFFGDENRRERDVRRHGNISLLRMVGDVQIGDVSTALDTYRLEKA